MEGYEAQTYGDRIADVYDDFYGEITDVETMVSLLEELAAGRAALELAIGTGRVALPLAGRGVAVSGIDVSERMVQKLRSKPGGAEIPVTIGNFVDVAVEGRFGLIYIVFNTLFALNSQDAQVRCFRNVADHLEDDGVFVVEAFVPDVTLFDRDQRVSVEAVEADGVRISAIQHDRAGQRTHSVHVHNSEQGTKLYPVFIRYAYPAELDLMARLAGLELQQRWGGWRREPFTAASLGHVSVYAKTLR